MSNNKITINKSINKRKDVSIILVTQNKLRHKRFIVRFCEEFEMSISKVLVYKNLHNVNVSAPQSKIFDLFKKISNLISFKYIFSIIIYYFYQRKYAKDMEFSEKRINKSFNKRFNNLKLNLIEFQNYNDIFSLIQKSNPDFLISLGGPLIPRKILNLVNGYSINQHAGLSPFYKGNYTTFWPLYHRQILKIGTTVHLTDTGADTGCILRRERVSIDLTDTPGSIFHKSVVAGTEIMIDTVKKIINGEEVICNKQNPFLGKTYLSKEFSSYHKYCIYKDWNFYLKNALKEIYSI